MRLGIVIPALLTLCPLLSSAAFEFTPRCDQAYRAMIRLQFEKAHVLLNNEKAAAPGNFLPHYVESYIDFLKAFITEERSHYEKLREGRTRRLKLLEREDHDSPYYRMCKAELYMQTAVLRIKNKEYLSATYEFRKANKLLEANAKRHPGFIPNKKCLGIMHALIGYVPSNYKWLGRILGFRGTIPQGLGELHEVLEASQDQDRYGYLFDEAAILLMFLEFHLKKDHESALLLAERIVEDDPGPLHLFSVLSIYLYAGRNEQAVEMLEHRAPANGEFPLHYLDFMNGIGLLNKLDPGADAAFRRYVENFRGSSFIRSAYQKLAWLSFMKGDTAGYHRNLDHVLAGGDDFTDEDKHATEEAEKRILPNLYLLRARLLFDGGYFGRALAELAGKDLALFPSFAHRLEFIYRLARIYDEMKMEVKAEKYYRKTVDIGEEHPYYFAANAALHMGRMAERQGDRTKAVTWYKRCLMMRNHEYQNSIDQRAEAGLNRLGAQ